MLVGDVRNKVDKIWETFWTGGVTNPLSVIEQITYLLFIKRLDEVDTTKELDAIVSGIPYKGIFPADKRYLRWSQFKHFEAEKMYKVVSQEVVPFIKNLHGDKGSAYSQYMSDAIFIIPTPQLLEKIVSGLDNIPMTNRNTKGDLYEYLLSKIATSGTNGQFRTPRHIIQMMVEMMKPTPEDVVCDPAAGSAGFLVAIVEYLRDSHGDLFLDKKLREHLNNTMFYGFDVDRTMLRIGAMSMMLHGVENPNIEYGNSLSEQNIDIDKYTLILTNPPFKGALDDEAVSKDLLKITTTKKPELLFLALFIRMLKKGGRCAVIVPDGVLFGSSKAHVNIRKEIIENHKLEAIISMPSGVFKPYAGVSTAIMIFTKTGAGGTDKVWFYEMQADGYSLDDRRNEVSENDIPDIITRFSHLQGEIERKRSEQSFFVSKGELIANRYELSINRYKEIQYEEIAYLEPSIVLQQILDLEKSSMQNLKAQIEKLDQFTFSSFLKIAGPMAEGYKAWKLHEIGDLALSGTNRLRTGPSGSNLLQSEFVSDGICVLGIDNAVLNRFSWKKRRFITAEKYEKLRRYIVYPEDVLITMKRTIGSAVVPKDIPTAISTKHLAVLTLNNEKANPYFISFCIHSHPFVLQQIRLKNSGAIMDGLNLGKIKSLRIPLPPLDIQNKFVQILESTEQQKELMQRNLAEMETNFNSLMQQAFQGELC